MKRNYIILLVCIALTASTAQSVQIVSGQFGYPMENVAVLSPQGDLLGNSNIDGYFVLDSLNNTSDFYLLSHPDIENDTLFVNQIKNGKWKVNELKELDELVIVGSPKDFIVIEGYFTTAVTNNDRLNGFADGIIQFAIKRKNGKIKKGKVLEYRFFKLENPNQNTKEVSSLVFDNSVRPPTLKSYKRLERAIENNTLKITDRGDNYFYTNDMKSDVTLKLLGYRFANLQSSMTFEVNSDELTDWQHLKKIYYNARIDIKHKNEPNYATIKTFSNFTVDKLYYKDRSELTVEDVKFKRDRSFYKSNFWETRGDGSLQSLIKGIFKENMKLQPNEGKTN